MNQNYTPYTSKIEELQFMFEAQTKIVCSLELEKIEMQKKIDLLEEEKNTLQGHLNKIFAIECPSKRSAEVSSQKIKRIGIS